MKSEMVTQCTKALKYEYYW